MPDYDFGPDLSSTAARERSIVKYEMDEGGIEVFTGTMETYIYELYDIPAILIELDGHGTVEQRLEEYLPE